MKLIDKDYLIQYLTGMANAECCDDNTERIIKKYIIPHINTLEVKEVNLVKELDTWRHNHFHGRRDKEASGEYLERVSQLDFAKYFFELGIKAQKGGKDE